MYYRALVRLEEEGCVTVSSKELALREKLTPAQVRKDLSFFGSFGTRGLGYPVEELRLKVAGILGINRKWNVALVGVGNIGSALVSYKEFQKQGFLIRKVFDNDQRKIGSNHKGIPVSDIACLEQELDQADIEIVVIAVPSQAAQDVADRCVKVGIKAFLNFAPLNLKVPDDVCLRTENMSMELEFLSFSRVNQNRFGKPDANG
jgi:redox-sensing transcriptional repressor